LIKHKSGSNPASDNSIQQKDISTGRFKMRILRLWQAIAAGWMPFHGQGDCCAASALSYMARHFIFLRQQGTADPFVPYKKTTQTIPKDLVWVVNRRF
jgi:hypothetical protein